MTTVLSVDGVESGYGDFLVLKGASLTVEEGQIVCIIGPNGAGKSTLFKTIFGLLNPTAGTSQRTDVIVNSGMSRTFQLARVFPDLTVRENMLINQEHRNERMVETLLSPSDQEVYDRADELLEFVGLEKLASSPAGELSTGQKKLLNIAGTLLSDPEIVLLDEPAAGVNPGLVDDIAQSILDLNDRGATFCIIEHDMDMIRSLSEYLYVLHNGTNLEQGEPETVLQKEAVLEAYFGQ